MSEPDTQQQQETPSSPRRIAASQANGKKSHGPTTPEVLLVCTTAGATARIKHGLLARSVLLEGESKERFDALVESLIEEHAPVTQSEHLCVQKMAAAYWRQVRTWSFQSMDFNREMLRHTSESKPFRATLAFRALCADNVHGSAHRYETAYDRQFYRALRELDALKAKRDPTLGVTSVPTAFAPSTWEDDPTTESPIE